MKKTLNTIFDEANANEIENLVSQNAVSEVSADTLSSIKSKVYAKTGISKTKKKKPVAFRWQAYAAVAACLILIVGGIFGAPSIMKLFNGDEPSDIVDEELPADINKILWANSDEDNIYTDNIAGFVEWNGWTMDYSLYEALNRASKTDFIAVVVSKNNSIDRDSFEYKGTTFKALLSERDNLRDLRNKLIDFPKIGESLKYGELLYTTGAPNGEKWAKELYDTTVAFYGEDFIAKYIVDGQVKLDLINEDLLVCESRIEEISNEMVELNEAYHESYVDDVEDIFVRSGACTIVRNGCVLLFVQKDELAKLKIDGKENYMLSLANRSSYYDEAANITNSNDTLDDTV